MSNLVPRINSRETKRSNRLLLTVLPCHITFRSSPTLTETSLICIGRNVTLSYRNQATARDHSILNGRRDGVRAATEICDPIPESEGR